MPRRKRRYIVHESKSKNVRIEDEVTPVFENAARIWPKETRRALRHVGYKLQGAMKKGLRSSMAGNSRLQFLSDITKKGYITAVKTDSKPRTKSFPGGGRGKSLVQAIGYQQEVNGNVKVGWLSSSAIRAGERFQRGAKYPVTSKMRRLFFAASKKYKNVRPLSKDKTEIDVPARPFIDPVHRRFSPRIVALFEARLARNLGIFDDEEFKALSKELFA